MRIAVVAHTVGLVVRVFGAVLVAPLLVDLYYGNREQAIGFAVAGASATNYRTATRRSLRRSPDGLGDIAGPKHLKYDAINARGNRRFDHLRPDADRGDPEEA